MNYRILLSLLVSVLLFPCLLFAQESYDLPFVPNATYDESIPHPDDYLGFTVGSQLASHAQILGYFQTLADAVPNAELTVFGHTHEERELIYLVISSQENMDRLDEIKEGIGKLADPRKLDNDREARGIIDDSPAIAWMSYGIHGDEVSSSDAAVWLAYQLVAGQDERTKQILKNTVVVIDPMQNPDGRERIRNIHKIYRGYVENPDVQSVQIDGVWPWGRGNHYFFDLNRDFFIQAHPESRARIQAFQEWWPQLFVDSHEMGSLDTYLFSPPRQPINHHVPDNFHKWTSVFAQDQAAAFDRYGWSYYSRDWFEDWYPGYSFWTAYVGAITILYEQAGVSGSAVKRPDGTTMTYRETVHHQITSSLTNLGTLADNREQLLSDYYETKKLNVASLADEEIHYYFIEPDENQGLEQELIQKLKWQGIECYAAEEAFEARELTEQNGNFIEEKELPEGTWIIPTRQHQKQVLKAILEFDPKLSDEVLTDERFNLEKKNRSRMYDWTGWSLAHAYGVNAYSSTAPLSGVGQDETLREIAGAAPDLKPDSAYLIGSDDLTATHAVTRLLEHGAQIRVSQEVFKNEGRLFPRGTFVLRQAENPNLALEVVQQVAEETGARIEGANTALSLETIDLGGRSFPLLAAPRIGVFTQFPVHVYSYGATWHFLDEKYRSRMSALNIQSIGRTDLRKYNVLVVPALLSSGLVGRAFGEPEMKKLRQWVENGGTLIALGNSVSGFAREKGLSAVRNRTDILDQLDVYKEFSEREAKALTASATRADIYGYGVEEEKLDSEGENGEDGEKEEKTSKPSGPPKKDKDALKRLDDWEKRFSPNGAILNVSLDPHHWLTHGVADPLSVMVKGSNSFYAKPPVNAPIRFVDKKNIRASGLLWPEARNRLEGAVYVTQESLGRGQVILFPYEPHERGYFPATQRILWNAIFLGAGLGANQPIPW